MLLYVVDSKQRRHLFEDAVAVVELFVEAQVELISVLVRLTIGDSVRLDNDKNDMSCVLCIMANYLMIVLFEIVLMKMDRR